MNRIESRSKEYLVRREGGREGLEAAVAKLSTAVKTTITGKKQITLATER